MADTTDVMNVAKRPHSEDSNIENQPQSPTTIKRIKLDEDGPTVPSSNGEDIAEHSHDSKTDMIVAKDNLVVDNNKQPALVNGDHTPNTLAGDHTPEIPGKTEDISIDAPTLKDSDTNGTPCSEDNIECSNIDDIDIASSNVSDSQRLNDIELPSKAVDGTVGDVLGETIDKAVEIVKCTIVDRLEAEAKEGFEENTNDVCASNLTEEEPTNSHNEEDIDMDTYDRNSPELKSKECKEEVSSEKTFTEESEQTAKDIDHLPNTTIHHNGDVELGHPENNDVDLKIKTVDKEPLEIDRAEQAVDIKTVESDNINKTGMATNSEGKENVDVNVPIDLSVKQTVNGHKKSESPDIIMLSDSDSEDNASDNVYANETQEQRNARKEKMVKKLQRELQNEEAKLMLLKKLRQSQLTLGTEAPVASVKGAIPRSSALPALVRPNQQHLLQKKPLPAHQMGSGHQMSSQRSTGPPPLVNLPQSRSSQHQSGSHHNLSTSSTTSSMIPGYRPVQPAPAAPVQSVDARTPEQRQASAKMALRKQLEKTLLQIPPPKPPVPEMNFIPSLSSGEFILLVGLNEVVNFIMDIDKGKPEVKYVFNPFTCVQCKTDFTPVWKRDKPGSKNVICENCVISNQKKALKQEHTNRLKSAFVKALQQEQQIEQQIAAEEHEAPSRNVSSSHQVAAAASSALTGSPLAGSVAAAAMNYTSKVSSEQLRQHQKMLEAHQAHLRSAVGMGLSGFNPLAFNPFQMASYANKNSKTTDIQRQYLLDMIPSAANLAQNVSWQKR